MLHLSSYGGLPSPQYWLMFFLICSVFPKREKISRNQISQSWRRFFWISWENRHHIIFRPVKMQPIHPRRQQFHKPKEKKLLLSSLIKDQKILQEEMCFHPKRHRHLRLWPPCLKVEGTSCKYKTHRHLHPPVQEEGLQSLLEMTKTAYHH